MKSAPMKSVPMMRFQWAALGRACRPAGLRWLGICFLVGCGSVFANVPYDDAQVAVGREAYAATCAVCHGADLEGFHLAPALVGDRFDQTWRGRPASLLSFHIRRMPPQAAVGQGLDAESATAILAFLLERNDIPAKSGRLPSELAALRRVTIPSLDGAAVDPTDPVTPTAGQRARLAGLSAVSATMRRDPSPADWLSWGRTQDGQRYSPLDSIDRRNVDRLGLAWRKPLPPGPNMPHVAVLDGVMFLHTHPDTVLALDATTGDVLWRYRHKTEGRANQKLGLALAEDKVIVPMSDKRVVALEATTGTLLWEHTIELPVPAMRARYQLRSAPLIAPGRVIQGVTASFIPKGGFIVGLDLATGEKVWQFDTVASPDDPQGHTWNGLPHERRSGGSVWHQGTYDPELGLVFFGAAPTYDTGPLLQSVDADGVTNEAFYTNCTLALDPETGRLVWFYQHAPNDQWDLDWAFERQLADVPWEGVTRRVVMTVGKMGILEALDAATGKYLFTVDAGVQNVIDAIDPESGAKTYDPATIPDLERQAVVCPTAWGARSWPETSFSPQTGLVYVPLAEWCMTMGKAEGRALLSSGVGMASTAHPTLNADGMLGRLQAFDVAEAELAWSSDQFSPISSSTMATAGGLVFAGDIDPSLKAYDAANGRVLWQSPLDALPSSSIASYAVDGVQYVALVAGAGNIHVSAMTGAANQFLQEQGREPLARPDGGTAIWVFSLEQQPR